MEFRADFNAVPTEQSGWRRRIIQMAMKFPKQGSKPLPHTEAAITQRAADRAFARKN